MTFGELRRQITPAPVEQWTVTSGSIIIEDFEIGYGDISIHTEPYNTKIKISSVFDDHIYTYIRQWILDPIKKSGQLHTADIDVDINLIGVYPIYWSSAIYGDGISKIEIEFGVDFYTINHNLLMSVPPQPQQSVMTLPEHLFTMD